MAICRAERSQAPNNVTKPTPHDDALRSWAKKLMQSKPFKLVAVALANKIARIAFAIMRGKTTYSAVPA